MLHEAGHLMAEADLGLRSAAQDVELDRRQSMLLEMQPIRIGRDVGEQVEIEGGLELAAAVADLPMPHLQAGLVHARRDAVGRHHLERRRMEGAGAQVVRERGLGFEQDHRDALPAERERAHQPGRAGTRDHDGEGGHHRSLTCPGCAAPPVRNRAVRCARPHLTSLVPVRFSRFLK